MISLTVFAFHTPLFRIPHLLVSSLTDVECAATGCGADWAETLLWNDYIPSSKILCCLDLVFWPLLFYCCCEERSTSLDKEQLTRVWLSNCTIIVFFWTRSEMRTEGIDIIEGLCRGVHGRRCCHRHYHEAGLKCHHLVIRELPYKLLLMCHERRISSHQDSKKPSGIFNNDACCFFITACSPLANSDHAQSLNTPEYNMHIYALSIRWVFRISSVFCIDIFTWIYQKPYWLLSSR